jgi:MFS superfamily sulfate permease-like transporter
MEITNHSTTRVNGNSERQSFFATVQQNVLPSVAVFLVALPLCMGIAIASGVPVAAGLITGIVGGLVVGTLSGAPLQVSGPAAGLTVIIYGIVQEFGLETLGTIVLGAGVIQIVAGLFGLGQWFRAVSPAVVKGMLAGIGLLIIASQFHVMIDDKPKESGLENLLTIPQAIAKGIGMPEPSTAEQRAHRTQLLKDIGMLHERQSEVEDAVIAAVPHQAAEASTPKVSAKEIDLSYLVDRQRDVNAALSQVVTKIDQLQIPADSLAKVRRASDVALEANQKALATLETGNGAAAVEAQHAASEKLQGLLARLKDHQWAAKVGVVTIVILLLWNFLARGRMKMVPAPLIAVSAVTAAAFYWGLPVLYVEVPDSLLDSVRLPSLNVLQDRNPWGILQAAAVVALIASAETLLCATAVDQLQRGRRTNYDRELWAQGVGNTICGLLGALPMTGVIVRSAANIQAGATSRVSAVLHGAWLLIFVSLLGFVLRAIPIASLAAVLVYTGYKLLDLKHLKELRKYGWGEVVIFMATFIGIVVTDLLTGVIIGVVLSAAKLLYTFSHFSAKLDTESDAERSVLSLEGTATFLRLPVLANALEQVPPNAELHVELERLNYIDHACLNLMMCWAKQHEAVGGRLVIDWNSLHAQFSPEVVPLRKSVA